MKRRTFVLSGAALGGALLVGWGAMPPRDRVGRRGPLTSTDNEVRLNGWIRIAADGRVLLAMNRSEMGQGVHTALPMLVAEQLDIGLDRIQLEQAGPEALYGNVAMFLGALPFHPDDREPGQRQHLPGIGDAGRSAGDVDAQLAPSCWAPRHCSGDCRWTSCAS